ncbi:MAG TPA: hypothetical protein VKU19_06640 [Bryobacteraceae bacterium]|nr:hypothetical protein [Bryobacteraceae bacterium]
MNPLNDDQLNELLRQAKAEPPEVSPAFDARVMRAYQQQTGGQSVSWWRRWWGPVAWAGSLRWRNVLAGIALVLSGALADHTLLASRAVPAPRDSGSEVLERVVYKDCPAPSQGPGLTFNELQPVREIRPRVVRSMDDDQ